MNDKTVALIDKLATALGSTAQNIVDAYTWQMIATSLVWIGFGALFLGFALWINLKVTKRKGYNPNDGDDFAMAWAPTIILGFIGLLVVFSNLSDLVAPQAAAIHQLLKDLGAK